MRRHILSRALLALSCLALVACEEEPASKASQDADIIDDQGGDQGGDASPDLPDGEEDAPPQDLGDDAEEDMGPPPPAIPLTPRQDGVSPDGASLEAVPGAGQVRAGRVQSGSGGFGGVQAACGVGDLVLVNEVARFCVEAVTPTNQIYFTPGQLIDAEPVGVAPWSHGGRDRLDSLAGLSDLRTGQGAMIEVIRDGTSPLVGEDGGESSLAVVRVTGPEEPIMYIVGVIGTALFRERTVRVVTEYRLRPDAAFLEIVTVLENTGEGRVVTASPGDIAFWGDTLEIAQLSAEGGLYGSLAHGPGVAYLLTSQAPAQTVDIPVDLPAALLVYSGARLAFGEQVGVSRYLGVAPQVGALMERLEAELPGHPLAWEVAKAPLRVTRGEAPVAGAKVELRGGDGALLHVDWTDEEGGVTLRGVAGAAALTVTDADGDALQQEVTLADGVAQEVALPALGALRAQVSARRGEEVEGSPGRLELRRLSDGARRRVVVVRGEAAASLPEGRWAWTLSRGYEYSVARGEVDVVAGQEATITETLTQVMPTPGFVSGEFHQHQSPSLDSEVAVEDRVLSNLMEGVDFAVASDHDIITDFGPVIEALGIEDLLATVTGVEVSPLWGHFGAYPIEPRADLVARGAPTLAWRAEDGSIERLEDGQQMISRLRDEFGARLVQVNHPRDNQAYFNSFSFGRDKALGEWEEGFSTDFDTMEVINGEDCQQLQDWFALLNLGVRIIGVGNSDTHSLSQPPGTPRNYIPAAVDEPGALTQDQIIDAVLTGDVIISGGAFLELDGDPLDAQTPRPGRLLRGPEVVLDLRVLTPPWASVDRLTVIRNGEPWEELEIGDPESGVHFDGELTLTAEDADAWFVLIAWSSAAQPPDAVYDRPAYAISNPLYLDFDGDDVFDAPGPAAPEAPVMAFCR